MIFVYSDIPTIIIVNDWYSVPVRLETVLLIYVYPLPASSVGRTWHY